MVVSILTVYAMLSFEPDDRKNYVPKSQKSRYSRLNAQWSLVLKSWLKQGFEKIELSISKWKTRKKYTKLYSMAMKHSTKHNNGTKLLALQAVAMSATGNANYNHQMFDTD